MGRHGWEGAGEEGEDKDNEGEKDSLEAHARAVVGELAGIHEVELEARWGRYVENIARKAQLL